MKTYIGLTLLASFLAAFPSLISAADPSSEKILHDTFIDSPEAIRWIGEANWERVNDKANGASDEVSLVSKNPQYSQLTVKLPGGEINPIAEKVILRMKVRVRLEGVPASDISRLELRLSDSKAQNFYIGVFNPTMVRLGVQYATNAGESNIGQWQTQRLTRDEQYHIYTLEIHPSKRVIVSVDDTVFDDQDIGDPDLSVVQAQVVFCAVPQSAGKWHIDDISVTREASISNPVQKP